MFKSAIGHLSEILITKPDAQAGRQCLRLLTGKLQELRQIIFKARTRLLSEHTRCRHGKRTRQLQLSHMIEPLPTSRHPKRPHSPNPSPPDTTRGPWRKKPRPPQTPDSSTPQPQQASSLRRPRSQHILFPNRQLTPQPPLLQTPHWTALRKRHRSPPPTTPDASASINAPTQHRKRLRGYLDPIPHSHSPHTSTPDQSHTETSPVIPNQQHCHPPPHVTHHPNPTSTTSTESSLDHSPCLTRRSQHSTLPPSPTGRKRKRSEPPLPIHHRRLLHHNGRPSHNLLRPPPPLSTTTDSRPNKRPNLNIADQPPLLTSTFWHNLQSRQGQLPPSSGDCRANHKF